MQNFQYNVTEEYKDKRLDVFLAMQEGTLTRSQVQNAVKDNRVWVNSENQKSSYRINTGDTIKIEIKDPVALKSEPENIPVKIVYEDQWIIVVNKAPGMVVHPACGNYSGTLVNALLFHCKTLSGIGGIIRPGIVHRLDKGTSGIMVVAKNDTAHNSLSIQFKEHSITRKYKALVCGHLKEDSGTIETLIGRHRSDRKKMSTMPRRGRQAITHWRVLENFDRFTLLEASLETGRTHQVRVHFQSIGHSIAGDHVYGSVKQLKEALSKNPDPVIKKIKRPLLHAGYLEFIHPSKNTPMSFNAPIPDDFTAILEAIRC